MKLTRRNFIKLSSITAAGIMSSNLLSSLIAQGVDIDKNATYIPTYCEMCFWQCGVVAKVVDGKVVTLYGNPLHPNNRGKLCAKGNAGIGLLYDPARLKYPMISTGKRGEGKYKKASWDEALNFVAEKMTKIKSQYGPEAMAYFAHGSVTGHFFPLIRGFGSPNYAFPSFAQCRGARIAAFELTYGEDVGSPERVDLANSKVIALFGTHLGENMHNSQVQDFAEGVGNGATLIVVDPRFSTAAGKAKYWLPIKPGADTALMLAWINILIKEGLYDSEYVSRYTVGFDNLKSSVKEYTPEWAEKETEIPADLIAETARVLGRNRPNVCVHPGRHSAWHGNDVQRERCQAILAAILGTWGRPGGLYLTSKAQLAGLPRKDFPESKKPSLIEKYPTAQAEGVTNVVRETTRTGKPYPIKGWLIAGTNLTRTLPNEKETMEAINNLDLLVAVDVMPYDTAMLADVVLPECSYLERHDNVAVLRDRSLSIAIRQPVVKPMYESKEGWWIAKELARRLGLGDYYDFNTFEDRIKDSCKLWSASYSDLKANGVIHFPNTDNMYITETNQPVFNTPSKKIELFSSELKEKGFDPLPKYAAIEQPGEGWFRLIYGRSPVHTFTRTTNNERLWELFKENEVWINTKVAAKMGISHGQYVTLENRDGVKSNRIKAKVTERIRPDCFYMVHGFGSGSKSLENAYKRGADDEGLISKYAVDPICGSTGMRINFIRVIKEA